MKSLFSIIPICLLASFTVNAQAILEADVWPGSESSSPSEMVAYNGKLYFTGIWAYFCDANHLQSYYMEDIKHFLPGVTECLEEDFGCGW